MRILLELTGSCPEVESGDVESLMKTKPDGPRPEVAADALHPAFTNQFLVKLLEHLSEQRPANWCTCGRHRLSACTVQVYKLNMAVHHTCCPKGSPAEIDGDRFMLSAGSALISPADCHLLPWRTEDTARKVAARTTEAIVIAVRGLLCTILRNETSNLVI